MNRYTFKATILTLCAALFVTVSSCKKGENDPAFTLMSRKARVTGDWKMQTAKVITGVKDAQGAHPGATYELTGDKYNLTTGKGGHFDGGATLDISFKKDGSFSIKQTLDTENFNAKGSWDFQGKIGKAKNKESLIIRIDDIDGHSNYMELFNKASTHFSYHIKELRKRKLVLVTEEEKIATDNNGNSYYVTSEYTFLQ